MSDRPSIGVLLDYEEKGSFSARPHHALRTAYFDAVWRAGGTPFGISYVNGSIEAALDHVAGLIIPGGSYPFPARLYGEDTPDGEQLHPRFEFEIDLLTAALSRKTPVLGICAGMQLIAAQAGIGLYKDLHTQVSTAVDHLDEKPAEEPAHPVTILPGTKLQAAMQVNEWTVNTAHNEAPRPPRDADDPASQSHPDTVDWPDEVILTARAPDGVIEGLERTDQPFCIGVQWHPEFFIQDTQDPNARLFAAFIDAALKTKQHTSGE